MLAQPETPPAYGVEMDLRQLKYFMAVAEQASFTRGLSGSVRCSQRRRRPSLDWNEMLDSHCSSAVDGGWN